MSAADLPPPRAPIWRPRRGVLATAAGAAMIAGGVGLALGPLAPWVVDHLADGRRVWRLGTLQIEGVRGAHLGALHAERLTLADETGVWAEARDVTLDWRPHTLLAGDVRLDNARVGALIVHRQPVLSARSPVHSGGFDVRLDKLVIDNLGLDQAFLGEAASFETTLVLNWRDQAMRLFELDLRRVDTAEDRIVARYDAARIDALSIDAAGAAGGILSRALGVPEQSIRFAADGDGDAGEGSARFAGELGGSPLADGAVQWTPQRWTLEADAQLNGLPALATFTRRFGQSIAIRAHGERANEQHEATQFSLTASTPFLALSLDGARQGLTLDGPARLLAETVRLSDIAREAPLELGDARFEGTLTRENGDSEIEGVFEAREINVLGRPARLAGPVRAELTRERFWLSAELDAPGDVSALFSKAQLRTEMEFDRSSQRFTLSRASLEGDAFALRARGWTNRGEGEFSGNWRFNQLSALVDGAAGSANGPWRAQSTPTESGARVWSLSFEGDGRRFNAAPEIVGQLLGQAPALTGMLRFEDGGTTVSQLSISGAKLRMGARGRIVGGAADLHVEASARGPIALGAAEIAGNADATGRLTGQLERPALALQGQLSSFLVAGLRIDQPEFQFSLAPDARGTYRGAADVRGTVSGQPLTASATLSVESNGFALTDLVANAGGLTAQGDVTFTPEGPEAQLALSGVVNDLAPGIIGNVLGDVRLSPEAVQIDVQLANARAGDLRLRAASITAAGPYDAIAGRVSLRGALRNAPLAFAGDIALSNENPGTRLSLDGAGALAGADIETQEPISVLWRREGVEASFDLTVEDGAVAGAWSERGRALAGSVTIQDAPLAPLAAIWGETATGRIEGTGALRSEGTGLAGEIDMRLRDARIAARSRGLLNMRLVGALEPSRITARIDARSTDGLEAVLEAEAPIVTSAAQMRIALAPERRGRATWSVDGPADALFAAARLQDQALTGDLDGQGELSFGAGSLSGDGRIQLSGGAFEDKISGVKLQNIAAAIGIGANGVTIERFTANDSRGGSLTATGGSANAREGRIALQLRDLRLVDRPDARARAGGELAFTWEGRVSRLSGDISIHEAEVSIAQNPQAGIPHLDVIEINRPGVEDEIEMARRPRVATALDVRINAPGRVYTRGRGVDAEWALDLRLSGTVAQPQVFGEARSVRGSVNLSGRPFDLERGRIVFSGAPETAQVDIAAVRTTSDLTARILLTGTAADPTIELTSDPSLPEDEILPQVLFGQSMADLSALEAAQLAASLAALSGQGSFDLIDAARAASGLDRFDVREDEDGGLLVAGGVYLTRDVYLEIARTGLGQAATRVEWTIRPQLVLITSFLPNGDQRASVRWRKEAD